MIPTPTPSLYNQEGQTDDQFVRTFVARHDELEHALNVLRHPGPGGEVPHQLMIGQRGMGKSTLLRRIAIAVMRDEALRTGFIPLRFREEQYNVIALATFWRNCSEALAEWCEAYGREAMAERIDRILARPAQTDADAAEAEFLGLCRDAGGRAVLLVDNLDLILGALKDIEQWALRRTLQRSDGPVLIGAATQLPAQSGDRSAPFYEFFHLTLLEPLDEAEVMRCMRALADSRGDAGAPVRRILAHAPERLRTLYALTGGNPRVLALLYQIIERSEGETVFADLEALLDRVTPYYKARVEDYATPQQRAVIDAIALHWDPMTSRAIADATGIEVTTISSHLTRLRKDGFIEEVATSGARAGYQIAERFLNIWYLMRHGTRRTRQKLRWLTRFLARLYSADDLGRMAAEARDGRTCRWHPDYREAVLAAYEESCGLAGQAETAGVLAADGPGGMHPDSASNGPEASTHAAAARARFDDAVALYHGGDVPGALAAFNAVVRDIGDATNADDQARLACSLFNSGVCLGDLGRTEDEIAAYDAVIEQFADATDTVLLQQVAGALFNKGVCLGTLGRTEDAIAAYDAVIERFADATDTVLLQQVAKAIFNKGFRLGTLGRTEDAIAAYDAVIERFADATDTVLLQPVARALFNKGVCLGTLGRTEDAIAAYDAVIERFADATDTVLLQQVAKALVHKGNRLFDDLGKVDEAASAYAAAHQRQPDEVSAAENLAWLFLLTDRPDDAATLRAGLTKLPPAGLALLDAGLALAGDNFGTAMAQLDRALGHGLDSDGRSFLNDLLRLLRLARARGYGEKLIGWLEESGHAERYAPVHAAFVAFVHGEPRLRDVNPEVRQPARAIHDRLTAGMRAAAARTPDTAGARRNRRGRKRT